MLLNLVAQMNDVVKILVGVLVLNALTIFILTAYIQSALREMYGVISEFAKLSYDSIETQAKELGAFKEKESKFFELLLSFMKTVDNKEKLNEKTKVSNDSRREN